MNSKECLERILNSPTPKMRGGTYLDIKIIESIKQDLDRLEKLEKVIKILKENLQLVLKQDIDPLINTKVYIVELKEYYKKYTGFETTQEKYELLKEVLEHA